MSSGGFEIEHKGAVVIIDEVTDEKIVIEDVVNPDSGEVLTDDWFESGDIYKQDLREKIKDAQNEQKIDSFINQL